jgi:truncated hemoglobin YjbI
MGNLFTRLGGETGLARIIDLQLARLTADEYLGEYFMGVDIDHLKSGLLAFSRKAFGDPGAVYRGPSLLEAHRGQLVTELAFDQFIDIFVDAARETGAAETDQVELRDTLTAMRASVITEFKPNPAYDYQSKPF